MFLSKGLCSLCPVYGKQIVGQVASHKGRIEFAAMLMSWHVFLFGCHMVDIRKFRFPFSSLYSVSLASLIMFVASYIYMDLIIR